MVIAGRCRLSGALLAMPLAAIAAEPVAPLSLGFGNVMQVVLGLGVVLAMVAGTAWLVRRFGVAPGAAGGSLKLRGAVAVGSRERVIVVEIEDTWIVVGVAPGRVNSLHTLPRPAVANEAGSRGNASTPSFAQWLKQTVERRDA